MTKPNFSEEGKLWRQGFRYVAGVDEVGRGAFAGPVVAAAVVWNQGEKIKPPEGIKIDDSKKLKPRQRKLAADFIRQEALSWGLGEVGPTLINRLGLGQATRMAFRKAVAACNQNLELRIKKNQKVQFLLIDAFFIPYLRGLRRRRQKAIVGGDEKVTSIAAASILAKVYRDNLMRKLSQKYKVYGWGRNKGYGSREHQIAIKKYGLTRLHRLAHVATFLGRPES